MSKIPNPVDHPPNHLSRSRSSTASEIIVAPARIRLSQESRSPPRVLDNIWWTDVVFCKKRFTVKSPSSWSVTREGINAGSWSSTRNSKGPPVFFTYARLVSYREPKSKSATSLLVATVGDGSDVQAATGWSRVERAQRTGLRGRSGVDACCWDKRALSSAWWRLWWEVLRGLGNVRKVGRVDRRLGKINEVLMCRGTLKLRRTRWKCAFVHKLYSQWIM